MPPRTDYYRILEVERGASEEDIRQSYRRLARQYHPDVNESPDAVARFGEITEAYEVLSDPEKKQQYDRFGFVGSPAGHPGGGGPGGSVNPDDFGAIFEEMFGNTRSPFGRARTPRSAKGADAELTMTVSFMVAALGGTERVRLSGPNGPSAVEVRIPAGIEAGSKLRLQGRGQPSMTGGPAGDLILEVMVGRHPLFRREGQHILLEVPITVTEAAFGAKITVPLLQGSAELRIPAHARSGQKLRLGGRGIPFERGRAGDIIAVLQIAAPSPLNPEIEELLRALGELLQNPRETGPWADVSRADSRPEPDVPGQNSD